MFETKVVEKIKTRILCSIAFSQKSYRLQDNVEKYCTARQATDYIIQRMRIACWITKVTDTLSEYVILLFDGNNRYANAPQCYSVCLKMNKSPCYRLWTRQLTHVRFSYHWTCLLRDSSKLR
jgi:hypothetical protein